MTPEASQRNNDNLGLVLQAVSEIKTMLSGLDERVRQLERATIEQSVTASNKLDALFRRVDEHSAQINALQVEMGERVQERNASLTALQNRVQNVEHVAAIARWLGAGLGMSILALVWAILTHQVSVR